MTNVKRHYDSSRRQQQARRNRDAVLDAAQRRLLLDGYATTTIAAIATDAEVSVETIYKSFGGKAGLVTAIWQRGLAGLGPVPAPSRSDQMSSAETDARVIIAHWVKLTSEVMPLVAPILLLIRSAAATDAEIKALFADTDAQRRTRMRHNAQALKGQLRPGITLAAAADVLWAYSSPDLYDLLVLRGAWSMRRYCRFLSDSMIAALLPPEKRDRKVCGATTAENG
jgi:AcrR family transcriptional regulator